MTQHRQQALRALDNHARRYGASVPDALKAFYESDFRQHNGRYVAANLEGYADAVFQLTVVPPSWLDKDDDAVNGPRGEWAAAKSFLPLFLADQALYLVVDLRTADCQVGWYEESGFDRDEEDYRDGAQQVDLSLAEFLSSLTEDAGDADPDTIFEADDEDYEYLWEEDYQDDGPRAFDVDHGD